MRTAPLLLTLLLATAPVLAAEPASTPEPTVPAMGNAERAEPVAGETDQLDRHCIRQTGTHLRMRRGTQRCSAFAGRVYTRDDLDRTGQVDIATALRMLDPSIR
jgi:hypothetical protein